MKNPARFNRYQNPKLVGALLAVLGIVTAAVVLVSVDKIAGSENQTEFRYERQFFSETESFEKADQMPELIGGLSSLQKKIRYPQAARDAGIEGTVLIEFTVDEKGRVVNPIIMRSIGGGCDEEAVRVLKEARFKPGKQHGRPVRVKLTIPITFRLDQSSETTNDAPVGLENPDARIEIDGAGQVRVNGEIVSENELTDLLKSLIKSDELVISILHATTPAAMKALEKIREILRNHLEVRTLHYRIEST